MLKNSKAFLIAAFCILMLLSALSQAATISGYVLTADMKAVPDVVMKGLPKGTITDANGFYSAEVPSPWSGSVTPEKDCFTFSPPSNTYSMVIISVFDNYTATPRLLTTISGRVTNLSGTGIADVSMVGFPYYPPPKTNGDGYYSVSVGCGWSGTVAPAKDCYDDFNPPSRTYSSVSDNISNDDYTAVPVVAIAIDGHIESTTGGSVAGVVMAGLPTPPTTDASGNYSRLVGCLWSGTVTPTHASYIFDPPSRTYSKLTEYPGKQNYKATPITYNIYGSVKSPAAKGIQGVVMSGLPGSPTTDINGNYSAEVLKGWSGTVTPTKSGFTFTPTNRNYSNVSGDLINQNYTGVGPDVTISGRITYPGGAGIGGVLMNGLPGTVLTDGSGDYSATVSWEWSGTVIPSKGCYSFTPEFRFYNLLISNRVDQDYTGTVDSVMVSGTVRTSGGAAISGVTMNGLPGSPVTNASGDYSAKVECSWTGTVTPTKTGYTFDPPSRTHTKITTNQSNQDYTGSLISYTISGYVRTGSGTGISGVVMNGLPGNPSTSGSGYYAASVTHGWSGTVSPTKAGYSFTPSSRNHSSVTSSLSSQNYTGTLNSVTIEGYVYLADWTAIEDVTLDGLPGPPVTDADGYYSAEVIYGWSGTVTPQKDGYTFDPVSRSYSNVTSGQNKQDFTGSTINFTISGHVNEPSGIGGAGLEGVTIVGLPGAPNTDADGFYQAEVPYNWTGKVVPTMDSYEFDPEIRMYENVTSDMTDQDYIGSVITLIISGYVITEPGPGGTGIGDVVMTGLPGDPTTSPDGYYQGQVPYMWSGTVVPTKEGFAFTPESREYIYLGTDQPDQDYNGSPTTDAAYDELGLPTKHRLHQNYPNPFNPQTSIKFSLAEKSRVRITIYNLAGQVVRRILDDSKSAGDYTIVWNGKDRDGQQVPSGIYLYRLETDVYNATRKMILIK
jgi:inhibitor of cysteine peptidase